MSPIPDAQAEAQKPGAEPREWTQCPLCGGTGYEVIMGKTHSFSMEPVCLRCGHVGPDLHFLSDPIEQQRAEMAELDKANGYRLEHDRRISETLKKTPVAGKEELFRLEAA
jgi:uncharacterized Zn finger protein